MWVAYGRTADFLGTGTITARPRRYIEDNHFRFASSLGAAYADPYWLAHGWCGKASRSTLRRPAPSGVVQVSGRCGAHVQDHSAQCARSEARPPSLVSEHRGTETLTRNPLGECHLVSVRAGAVKTDQPRLTCRRALGGAHEPRSDCSDALPVSAPWPTAQPEILVPKGRFKASARLLNRPPKALRDPGSCQAAPVAWPAPPAVDQNDVDWRQSSQRG